MTPNTFSVHFIVRNNRMDEQGFVPIYARITVNGERIHLSLNHKIKPSDWINKTESAKSNSNPNKEINVAIEALKSRIYQAHSHILATNKILNAENLRKEIFGEKIIEKVPTLIETAKEHNENFEQMIGIKYSQGSYKNYKTTLKYLIEFVPAFSKKKDIPLKAVDYKFCEAYFNYLTSVKTCNQNGANKQIQRLKKIINYAIKLGYLLQSNINSFTLQFTPANKVALTMDELKKLKKLNLKRETLEQVRDVFLLQCYTGLSYGDVKRLSLTNIEMISENEYWIKMSREKTKVAFSVPLLPDAMEILNRYVNKGSDGVLLRVLTNQRMNDNLKIIQELAGISKNLTTHLARHTFATTYTLGHGVPIETVSKMLGHTKLATTQIYAKVLDGKIGEDMAALKKKLNNE